MRRVPAIAIVMLLGMEHLYAEPSDRGATATQLFNEGRKLAEAERWAEACPKFEASLRYEHAPGTRINLAICYERIGKLASAWALFREAIDIAGKTDDAARLKYAQNHAAALEPRLPRLAISAAKPPAGFIVTRNGAAIDARALGIALYVDPGIHEIAASAPGFEPFKRTVTIAEGKTETVMIPALKPVPDTPVHNNAAGTTEAAVSSRTRKFVAIGGGALGVATLGAGLLVGAAASSKLDQAKALCGTNLVCAPADSEHGKQLIRDARARATTSTVLTIAGSAAIVAGAIVFLFPPRRAERATVAIVPVIQDSGVGLAFTGGF